MTIMATVNGQTMVGHRFLCKVLYIRTPTKCKVLYTHTQPTTKSKVYATVSSETTCVMNTKTIQSTVSHAKCILFLPPLPGGPGPTQCNILLATALTKINGVWKHQLCIFLAFSIGSLLCNAPLRTECLATSVTSS